MRPTRSRASSFGSSSSVCSSVSAEPRIEVRGVRRSCETASRNVFFISSSARSRCAASRSRRNASEYLRSLRRSACSARLRSVMSIIRPAELSRALSAAHHVHHVADPDRASVGRGHAVLQALVLAGVGGDPGGRDAPSRSSGERVIAPAAPLRDPFLFVGAQELFGAAADEREPERRGVRLPEDRVQAGDQLVEPLQLREAPCVAQGERRDVGDPAGQPQVLLGEPSVDVLGSQARARRSRRAPSAAGRPGPRGPRRRARTREGCRHDVARDDERLGLAREEPAWRHPTGPATDAFVRGDRVGRPARRDRRSRKSPVSSSRRYAARPEAATRCGTVSIASCRMSSIEWSCVSVCDSRRSAVEVSAASRSAWNSFAFWNATAACDARTSRSR